MATTSASFSNTSPYVGLQFQATPDIMVYAKASKGFRAGGDQFVNSVSGWVPYDQETAWTYEIGSRMEFLDKRLRINPTVFYTDWKNIQFNALDPIGEPYTRNAGDAVIKGAELEVQLPRPGNGCSMPRSHISMATTPASIPAWSSRLHSALRGRRRRMW